MRRNPNVKEVVAQVLEQADAIRKEQHEKVAAENAPSFRISSAAEMHKLAQALRDVDPERVTVADVEAFATQLQVQ